ncbi:MAG: ABC transporter substrate-binding protein [Pseudomonadota bacterium]
MSKNQTSRTARTSWQAATFVVALALAMLTIGHTSDARAADKSSLRILSIGSDVTEILYELGFGDQIVAVDTTSQYPPEALENKPNVGYMRALSPEGVLSVGANLILASAGSGPPETIRALKASSARYVEVPAGKSAEGILTKVEAIAAAVDAADAGARLKDKLAAEFKKLGQTARTVTKKKKVLFVLNATGGRIIVGGAGTSADEILRLAAADNAAANVTGFKPLTTESVIAMAPDAIIVMKGGRGGLDAAELGRVPAIRLTPAGKAGELRDMSGVFLLGFGPRAPKAAASLIAWLYPERAGSQ